MTEPPPSTERSPSEIRAYESQVWDFAKHLVHPAAVYVAAQVALWVGLEGNAAFRGPRFGFWEESLVHGLQFLGAWAVLYGTLLRDMRERTVVPTLLAWFAFVGAVVVYAWPGRTEPAAADALRALLGLQLVAGVVGWAVVLRTWRRAKRAHEAAAAGGGA